MPTKSKKETGVDTQIWAARSIAQVFEKLRLPFDRTEKPMLHLLLKIFYRIIRILLLNTLRVLEK